MMIFISLMLNLFTILDLYIVLTNPFKNPSGRPAMWLWTSVSIAFIFSTFSLIETEDENSRFTETSSKVFDVITVINIVISFIVLLLVYLRLKKGGTSMEIKKQISTRYVEFVLVFVLLSFPIVLLMKPSYTWLPDPTPYAPGYFVGGTKLAKGLWIPVCGFGILMAVSRLRDQAIRKKFQEVLLYITCRRSKLKHMDWSDEQKLNINAILQSTLNTEVVISILKGITILAASSSDNADNITDSDMLQVEQTVTIKIKSIKIKDADNFNMKKKAEEERALRQTLKDEEKLQFS
jgi:hypothetical protein